MNNFATWLKQTVCDYLGLMDIQILKVFLFWQKCSAFVSNCMPSPLMMRLRKLLARNTLVHIGHVTLPHPQDEISEHFVVVRTPNLKGHVMFLKLCLFHPVNVYAMFHTEEETTTTKSISTFQHMTLRPEVLSQVL